MPPQKRAPMPKLPPFALMNEPPPRKSRPWFLVIFLALFGLPLLISHLHLLHLPFYWDELGQFVPSALDLARSGALVPHSVIPNVHPPGVEAYLALCYKLFGFSIPLTRVAMLFLASCGLLLTFLLAIELSRGTKGAPAFMPPVLLLASPLFYTQSMLAQLDMPAMVMTLAALLFFIKRWHGWAVLSCVALVLVKETGIVVPFVFFVALAARKDWKTAALYLAPPAALLSWLVLLHAKTGNWLGSAEFARYNVNYAVQPARIALALARRLFYLFIAEFRWLGTLVLALAVKRSPAYRTPAWIIVLSIAVLSVLEVSVFGGAELERYLLPVLPLLYIAFAIAISTLPRFVAIGVTSVMLSALVFSVVWNPPYPCPFENNYAMVDFVHLEQTAATYAETNLRNHKIATAWPYTAALRNPDYGFVERGFKTIETHDLHYSSLKSVSGVSFDTLITYTREWPPGSGITRYQLVRNILRKVYAWEPDITPQQCHELGFQESVSWSLRGQTLTIYRRAGDVAPGQDNVAWSVPRQQHAP